MIPGDRPVREGPLVVVDVETTGLDPARGHRVCEVAAIRYEADQPTITLQQLVNPQRRIDPGALNVHGITPAMLTDAPLFAELAPQIAELTKDVVLVGHNVWFDIAFLDAELERVGYTLKPLAALDTLGLSRSLLQLPRYNLQSVSSALRVQVRARAHRALADAQLTWGVLSKLLDYLAEDEIVTLDDVLKVQRGPRQHLAKNHSEVPPAIQRALAEGLQLRLHYADASGRTTDRVVQPLRVVAGSPSPALEAYCHLRHQMRNFRLDRIVDYDLIEGES